MTPAIPAASASAAPRRAGKGAAPATPAWSAQPPSRTAAHANTAFAGAPRIPRPPSPQEARAPALFAPSPPLAHAAQTVPQPQAIPTQTHPIHRSSIKVGNDARTLKGVLLKALSLVAVFLEFDPAAYSRAGCELSSSKSSSCSTWR